MAFEVTILYNSISLHQHFLCVADSNFRHVCLGLSIYVVHYNSNIAVFYEAVTNLIHYIVQDFRCQTGMTDVKII